MKKVANIAQVGTVLLTHSALAYVVTFRGYATSLEYLLIKRFIKEVYNLELPKSKYSSLWETDILLRYWEDIRNNPQLNLVELSKKVTALLLLLNGLRMTTIRTLILRKKSPYLEFFLSVFSRIRTEYKDLIHKSTYSV